MKLRIRSSSSSSSSVESERRETTIRIEIEDACSLLQLKTLIASKLSISSPESLSLSLNREVELSSPDPTTASLRSLGLASGDLLFCCAQTLMTANSSDSRNDDDEMMEKETYNVPVARDERENEIAAVDDMEAESSSSSSVGRVPSPSPSPSVPCFLKRVLESEKQETRNNLGFFVVAVHAVFLESGFVGDTSRSRLPKGWNSATTGVSVCYTLPHLLTDQAQDRSAMKFATLKFSAMRNHISVYGSLGGESDVYRLCWDLSKLLPSLLFLPDAHSDTVLASVDKEEEEVFNFWKSVKDGLCLPLLIDICDKNGLPPPPCFARLPTELKMHILELLPGVDVAIFGCSSSEMRYLASNDDLWKQKFMEEFGQEHQSQVAAVKPWKQKFSRCWINRRDMSETRRALLENAYGYQRRIISRYPPFAPQRFPFLGGDYDRFPVFGNRGLLGPGSGIPRLGARRSFSPSCNLGGRSGDFVG